MVGDKGWFEMNRDYELEIATLRQQLQQMRELAGRSLRTLKAYTHCPHAALPGYINCDCAQDAELLLNEPAARALIGKGE